MPIGGGTFTLQNKVLPGVYMNFVSASGGVSAGSRGIASIPAELGWGAEDTIIRMDSGDFNRQAVTVFGYDATAPELLLIREAFKRAKTLLVYRVDGGGSKATKEIGGITVTAQVQRHPGQCPQGGGTGKYRRELRCGDLSGYHRDGPSGGDRGCRADCQ